MPRGLGGTQGRLFSSNGRGSQRGVRVLHAIHDFLPRHAAGSELYAFNLATQQRNGGIDARVLCADYNGGRPYADVEQRSCRGIPIYEVNNTWRVDTFASSYSPAAIERVLAGVLDDLRPDVLHVHNLLNLSFRLPALAKARGIPVLATLHDYTLLCPSGGQRVHVAEHHVCWTIDEERCARCFEGSPFAAQIGVPLQGGGVFAAGAKRAHTILRRRLPRTAGRVHRFASRLGRRQSLVCAADISDRLAAARHVFEVVDSFVAPSRSLADEYEKFGLPPEKLEVSDYGFPDSPQLERAEHGWPRAIRFGFLGTLVWHKGVHCLIEAFTGLKADATLDIFGSLDTFPPYVEGLRDMAQGHAVEFHGQVANESVPTALSQLDVLVVPSLWPENSPLVIHEAFQQGVYVVGAEIGGIPGLLDSAAKGATYSPPDDAAALRAVLRSICDAPPRAVFSRTATPVKPIEVDAREWMERYQRLLASGSTASRP